MSEYSAVAGGSLKLKGVSDHKIKKKKKKKDKEREASKVFEQISSHGTESKTEEVKVLKEWRTKAQIAADKAREKKKAQEIIEKASKTHKERIMEFNNQLDNLSEHFDIPKVSWTK